MEKCIREGNFKRLESHHCFICNLKFSPGISDTCEICNWKKCKKGHCGCSLDIETRVLLDRFYSLFCKTNNYSKDSKNALKVMLKTYYENCRGAL